MIKKIISAIFIILISVNILFVLIQLNRNKPLSIIKYLNLQDKLSSEYKTVAFRVNFLGIFPVGEAQLENKGIEIYQDKEVYHLSAKAFLLKFISKFFSAQAWIDSYVDKDSLYSLKFIQNLVMSDKSGDIKEVLYDQKNHIMELEGIKRQILSDTQDPLSAMFYLQHKPLELGKEFDININTNQKNYRLYAKVIKKENYKIANETVGVWVIKGDIRRRDKSPYHSSIMALWLLDDYSKTPILIKAMTNIGSVTARIINVE